MRLPAAGKPCTKPRIEYARPHTLRWPPELETLNEDTTRAAGSERHVPPAALRVSALCHRYACGRVALDDLSFKVETGACVAIVGANGAGKTTLFLRLCGVLAGICCGYLILSTTFTDSPLKKASVNVWGFRGPLGAFIAAWAGFVNELGHQLLSRSGFSEDMNRRLAASDARDHFAHMLHGLRGSEQARTEYAGVGVLVIGQPDCGGHQFAQTG